MRLKIKIKLLKKKKNSKINLIMNTFALKYWVEGLV